MFMSASSTASDQTLRSSNSLEAAIAQVPSGRTSRPSLPGAIAQERADRVAALSAALDGARPARSAPARARVRAARGRVAHRPHRCGSDGRRRDRPPGAPAAAATAVAGRDDPGRDLLAIAPSLACSRGFGDPVARPGPSHGERERRAQRRQARAQTTSEPRRRRRSRRRSSRSRSPRTWPGSGP